MKVEKHLKPFDTVSPIDDEQEFGKMFVKRLTEIFFEDTN